MRVKAIPGLESAFDDEGAVHDDSKVAAAPHHDTVRELKLGGDAGALGVPRGQSGEPASNLGIVEMEQICHGNLRCAYDPVVYFICCQVESCLDDDGAVQSGGLELFWQLLRDVRQVLG